MEKEPTGGGEDGRFYSSGSTSTCTHCLNMLPASGFLLGQSPASDRQVSPLHLRPFFFPHDRKSPFLSPLPHCFVYQLVWFRWICANSTYACDELSRRKCGGTGPLSGEIQDRLSFPSSLWAKHKAGTLSFLPLGGRGMGRASEGVGTTIPVGRLYRLLSVAPTPGPSFALEKTRRSLILAPTRPGSTHATLYPINTRHNPAAYITTRSGNNTGNADS